MRALFSVIPRFSFVIPAKAGIQSFFILLLYLASSSVCAEPQPVYVGVYLNDIINVDLKSNTYVADFYLWFKWQGKEDPSSTFEFVNAFEKWTHMAQKVYETPQVKNGWKYQVLHVNGSFHHPFLLNDYPLDEQKIMISIEDSLKNGEGLNYVADTSSSSFRKEIKIPGWEIKNQEVKSYPYTYPTNFGLDEGKKSEQYSRLEYNVTILRHKKLYLFKMLLPIFIVLLCALVIYFISPVYSDSRLALCITALVSAVAMHITVSADLPSVGYLVLIDKIYNLSYLTIFLSLAETVFIIYLKDKGQLNLAEKMDKISLLCITSFFVISCIALVSFRI